MGVREEIMEIRENLEKLKEQGFAMEILSDYKKANKRMFIALMTVIFMWVATIGVFMYYICTYDYVEEVITETVTSEGEGNACIGDGCINGEVYGNSN
jgi:hypothetical protein